MESEECAPAASHQPTPTTPARNRKRAGQGAVAAMSSSVEAQVSHHHDKVLRSHTRRGRCTPVASITAASPSRVPPTVISRRRQRSSGCSSQTDEEDGCNKDFGEVSVSLLNFTPGKGKAEVSQGTSSSGSGPDNNVRSSILASNNGNNKEVVMREAGDEQTGMIPASSSCFTPTNETKEPCEQAGLLGGTTKTTTIHSGGTRLSSSCIPAHDDLTTQQCRSNNAGEHSASHNKSSDNARNCSQQNLMPVEVMGHNNAPRSQRRSRQHTPHRDKSTPPAAPVDGDEEDDDNNHGKDGDNIRRGRRESRGDNNDEMCEEDTAASCELPGKPNAAQAQSSATTASLLHAHSPVSASLSSSTSVTLVKSERATACAPENAGRRGERNASKRGSTEQHTVKQEIIECDDLSVKREVAEGSEDFGDFKSGTTAAGALQVSRGGHDGRWSGEDVRDAKSKDGARSERKVLSSPLPTSAGVCTGGASMPQKSGLRNSGQDEGGNTATAAAVANEQQSRGAPNHTSMRGVKKCASVSKKQQQSSAVTFVHNNNNISVSVGHGGGKSAAGNPVERKKAPIPAPMLLMNNLPYMGELTFDTRPRRGRKPKKADICHLISKNYGIQFPAGVTQATPASSLPILNSKSVQVLSSHHTLAASHKKTNHEAISATNNNASSRSLVPPTFCNRDVSIVPIIPTSAWGKGSGGGGVSTSMAPTSSKCSQSANNLFKPLTSLAQQLMLNHHQNNPSYCSAASSRAMTTMVSSSPQQSISMFPLPTPSSYSQTHHHSADGSKATGNNKRNKSGNRDTVVPGDDEEESAMEVDSESHGGGDGEDDDNQDSPLNLCMRDSDQEPLSLVKEESLDVRWSQCEGRAGASKVMVRSNMNHNSSVSYSSDGAKESGSNKRSMGQSSSSTSVMKGGKSAKLAGNTTNRTPSSLNYSLANSSSSNICDSESVSNLVSCRPVPSPSAASSYANAPTSKLSPNIFAISAHHLQTHENATKGGGKSKQSGQNRKKRDVNIRGDVSISAAGSSNAQTGLSSFGGTLFGQSTAGINDGAEVSICKFKFTGGAKPCLQEKKMLSVDSGGNFRFYSDKTSGAGVSSSGNTGKLSGKVQTQQGLGSSNSLGGGRVDLSQSPPTAGDGNECHYALSSLPKSAKSMSMCMPMGSMNSSVGQVHMGPSKGNSAAGSKLSLPLMSSSAPNACSSLSLSPTTEELQQLHLSMQEQGQNSRSSSRVSPYPSGDYSYSSSNSCSSSDNGDTPSSSKNKRQHSSGSPQQYQGGSGNSSSSKMKLKRKRRTRKSLMREKLEKTFKEKGFLIQTQQLESAEGATYCKFRQLRKFTRYLFRSWKDYLPDHVKEISDNNPNNPNNAVQNNHLANSSAGHKGDGSNVQSMPDEEGDLEDYEDDGDEEDEVDSEEQPQQHLISQGITDNKAAGESDEEIEPNEEREVFKESRSRKGKNITTTSNSGPAIKQEAARSMKSQDDAESNKDDDDDDVELEVDT